MFPKSKHNRHEKISLTTCLVIPVVLNSQSCLPEGILFKTQEQIDNFQSDYPDCTEIEGYVSIQGNDITNFHGLSVLTSIGNLSIGYSGSLTSLTGLEGLISIGGDLWIVGIYNLTSLTGLDNLTSIEGDFHIGYFGEYGYVGNTLLTSLDGLSNVIFIGALQLAGFLAQPDDDRISRNNLQV